MNSVQDEAKQMKCVICHGDAIEPQNVREELHRGDDIVYANVDALVCTQCGERYFDRQTVRHLEQLREKLRAGQLQLRQVGKVMELAVAA